ncbi:hypothetical protein, partial [Pseudomonas costantinii]|uniref:hypothetical protein n=1 Tax=Pseudomonas costantinii TaxID=168469 RepID=UPI001C432786
MTSIRGWHEVKRRKVLDLFTRIVASKLLAVSMLATKTKKNAEAGFLTTHTWLNRRLSALYRMCREPFSGSGSIRPILLKK